MLAVDRAGLMRHSALDVVAAELALSVCGVDETPEPLKPPVLTVPVVHPVAVLLLGDEVQLIDLRGNARDGLLRGVRGPEGAVAVCVVA